jgi:hypothetical protein
MTSIARNKRQVARVAKVQAPFVKAPFAECRPWLAIFKTAIMMVKFVREYKLIFSGSPAKRCFNPQRILTVLDEAMPG